MPKDYFRRLSAEELGAFVKDCGIMRWWGEDAIRTSLGPTRFQVYRRMCGELHDKVAAFKEAALSPSDDGPDDRDVNYRRYTGMNDVSRILVALAFAAERHRRQRRKDVDATPYINHVIDVTTILAVEGEVVDLTLLIAALLHDTVEDTATSLDEVGQRFGEPVREVVAEVTDDKGRPKQERKRLQVEHAPTVSARAKQLKIADKIANLRDLMQTPPKDWPVERKIAYFDWAQQVVAGCRGENALLDTAFDRALENARRSIEE